MQQLCRRPFTIRPPAALLAALSIDPAVIGCRPALSARKPALLPEVYYSSEQFPERRRQLVNQSVILPPSPN